jgi:signal transduction histidine kinase
MSASLENSSLHKTPNISLQDISVAGQVRLMEMAYSRLRFGLLAMPVITVIFALYYRRYSDDLRVVFWSACDWILFMATRRLYLQYQYDRTSLADAQLLARWLPRIHMMVMMHGLLIAAFLPLVSATTPDDFKMVYTCTLIAMVAGNATHQSPMISVFRRFLFTSWQLTVVMMPWTFGENWPYITSLAAFYSVGMYYFSQASHRFFLQLVWLEEEGAKLAEQYKHAKDEAESALHAKNQFLSTASHDLRQPIHAMGFLIESISKRNQQPDLDAALIDLKHSVRSATHMFNSLLDLSKIESGVLPLRTGNILLSDLTQDVVTLYAEEANARGLALRVHVSPLAIGKADGLLLRQSLMNLIHNALRYTKSGGVLVACRKRGSDWQLEVWDTGVGVALEDQEKIFSPFFRNEYAWQIDNAGHGLGLSVVARCCQLMGSTYGFTSRLGRGSCFWLRVPAMIGKMQAVRIVNQTMFDYKGGRSERLTGNCLIVDDDPQVTKAWESLLTSWGLHARCVSSSTEALTLLDEGYMPNVVLCDQRLRAGESGFDILQAILERCPNAHGAMVSGEFNSPELLKAEEDGYLVLHKPLEPEALYTLLDRWL